ncbi:oligoendopeptidase F [bacterium]|nr:oligoendopeptidase F [bacterium]
MLRPDTMKRDEIPQSKQWDLTHIFRDWDAWQTAYEELERKIESFQTLKGTLGEGPDRVLEAYRLSDAMGQIAHKVFYYPMLMLDQDQRVTENQAKQQQVQILTSKWQQATAWLAPELLTIPQETMETWIESEPDLQPYRFPIMELYRSREHVLDEKGETLLSLAARFSSTPSDIYSALSTADVEFPEIELTTGETVKVTYGRYSSLLATHRVQEDRRKAFEAHYSVYRGNLNSYAAIYNSVCQRDWFKTQARNHGSTLERALHGDHVPVEVVQTLVDTTKQNTAPLQRYHRLRKQLLTLKNYHLYDSRLELIESPKTYPYDEAAEHVIASVAPLGEAYQAKVREAFERRWIDVYENEGKRSGAYSAGVYGVHPYMLLNYNDTLDDVFTLAHEMGHTMHTILSHENQPFATSDYTIFVAEVASTLNEAFLLQYMLERTNDPLEKAGLLQHSIDSITGTFFTQVMFADFEWQAHRAVEQGQPVTSETLNGIYHDLMEAYYADAIAYDEEYDFTWARIPHFYGSPYYVYQYATCYASSAELMRRLRDGDEGVVSRYMELLKAGGNDHPMTQLQRAGVDLTRKETIESVPAELDRLVTAFEQAVNQAGCKNC